MKKINIFVVMAILLATIIVTAALAAEWPDNRWQKSKNWSSETIEQSESNTPKRESRDFSDEDTFFNRMAAYCGRMMGNGYYESTPRGGYGNYSCH